MTKPKTFFDLFNGRAFCFASNPLGNGHIDIVLVIDGEEGFVPWPSSPDTTRLTEEEAEALVDEWNKSFGITPDEKDRMMVASMRKQRALGFGCD
jgi:hypothetical protein